MPFDQLIRWPHWVLAFIALLCIGVSTGSQAQIAGSAHDFTSSGWATGPSGTAEICVPCHTPHHSDTTVTNAPLWNHTVSSATFTVYASPTMSVTMPQPGGISLLCLSCHDGTVALDSFGSATGGTHISGAADLGVDLSDDHPVGIEWSHQTKFDGGCNGCHTFQPPPNAHLLPFFAGGLLGTIECATCHDVHNGAGFPNLTRMSMVNSAMCRVCHGK